MTVWRLSACRPDGHLDDIVADAAETATIDALLDRLDAQGYERRTLEKGLDVAAGKTLVDARIRHGAVLGKDDRSELGPGWYLVAIAGPDTGSYCLVGDEELTVGRSASCGLRIADTSLSSTHFGVVFEEDGLIVRDLESTNGTQVEGLEIDAHTQVRDGGYIQAGATTFGVVRIQPDDLPAEPDAVGASEPFQRRFREALEPLPTSLKHPSPPSEQSSSNRRPLISFLIPIVTAVGMATITGRYIFLLVIALGPIFFAIDGIRRRRLKAREEAAEHELYQRKRDRFLDTLSLARREEQARDRWVAAPAGLAALLAELRHQRMWERSPEDADFCEVAIGLHERPSAIDIDGRPDDTELDMDVRWSAVLRHSLVREGPLAVKGPISRARALGRALAMDLAAAHSPNDLKIWLLTDGDTSGDWNPLRWLPHNFSGESQSRIYTSPAQRASAMSQLRSLVNDRRSHASADRGVVLPIHVILVDCLDVIDSAELTDLLVDGADVGVIGVVIDDTVTPEGTRAQITLGRFADEADFVSRSQPRAGGIRSFEMTSHRLERAARSMAAKRPAGSSRDDRGGAEVIRLVELIGASLDPEEAEELAVRWTQSAPTSRVRVGGLGDLITEIDIMRDGPHGLVAGTTRSGKTEFLKSLITALAVANHPDDLSIVIVDFKGGVDHELSASFPHVIDLSTNHNEDSFVRTVRLIDAELLRRQTIFRGQGTPNFDAYQAARQQKPELQPVPRLLVIVDEFSELLSSETGKSNLSSLESVTRVGGGLGVHLLLVTQSFENQLPAQIAANAGLRICFRVQEPAHSKAVLTSPEAASIPKERIGRAFLRSHGGPAIEFQSARIAGPRPGKEVALDDVSVRLVPFSVAADPAPQAPILDVPAEDTDMYALMKVVRRAAELTGWSRPAVPWPGELPSDLSVAAFTDPATSSSIWPVGLVDEPDHQRQSVIGFEAYGPHTLLLGGARAGLSDVVRSLALLGAAHRGPESLHMYVIDQLGQGLGALEDFPHVGGVAERNEPLGLRILRHVGAEVAARKSTLSELGFSDVKELHQASATKFPDLVLIVHGADRLLMHGESQQSPLLAPLLGLVSDAVGTGVRIVLTGPPALAHHRIGSSMTQRYVFECADVQEYGGIGVPRVLQSSIKGRGRAVDVDRERLVQFALVPSTAEASATDVVRAVGKRLSERHDGQRGALPARLRELPWPLPMGGVQGASPPTAVEQPVALCVDTDTGRVNWLDADEDGPCFVVTGSTRSGRSSALIAAAQLMQHNGWTVVGMALSRRSPMLNGAFPGQLVDPDQLRQLASQPGPMALFLDDVHKWTASTEPVTEFLDGGRHRAMVMSGPLEFFSGRSDLVRLLPTRCALILSPRSSADASQFGARRLSDDVLRDGRAGRGVLVVAGEVMAAQVPLPDPGRDHTPD